MLKAAAWVSAGLAFGMALLQAALALGAPLGEYALGGKHRVLPPRMKPVSVFFASVFIVIGLMFLQAAESILPVFNETFVMVVLAIYTLFLAYAVIGNGFITKSKKERFVMTPISLVGFVTAVLVLIKQLFHISF